MINEDSYHPLLLRQIKRLLSKDNVENQNIDSFIDAINESYHSFERDNNLHEHAFTLAEQEYEAINKKLQEEIRKKDQAEQYSAAKNVFLANISHEVRTPMNVILGLVRQVLQMDVDTKVKELLLVVEDASDHMLSLLNDLLDVSKIESGKIELEEVDFDLIHTIEHSLNIFKLKAEEKGLLLTAELPHEEHLWVKGDGYRFKQIIINLLSNAIKFTNCGSVKILLTDLRELDNAYEFTIKVRDTGIGMSKTFQDQLFQRFSQEDVSSVRKVGGSGLGMTITREIIHLMSGDISVESELGKGTVFSVDLQLPKGSPPKEDLSSEDSGIHRYILRSANILVAEDNIWNKKVLELLLDKMKANYVIVNNGEEVLESLRNENFDLILMDIQMPIMDGYEATRLIRNTYKSAIPIIALTANAQRGEREKCISLGMDDYLSKPFTEQDLIHTISKNISVDSSITDKKPSTDMENGEKLYDLKAIRELADGDEDFVSTMVNMFKEESSKMVDEMKQAVSNRNIDQVGKVAHKLKPTIDQFEITSLKEEVRAIEQFDREGSINALSEKVNKFAEKLNAIAEEMVN